MAMFDLSKLSSIALEQQSIKQKQTTTNDQKLKSCCKVERKPNWCNVSDMSPQQRELLFGTKRTPSVPLKRGFHKHPSAKFAPLAMPTASLFRKHVHHDEGQSTDQLLKAISSQETSGKSGEIVATKNYMTYSAAMAYQSTHAFNNQVFAQSLLPPNRKSHRVNKHHQAQRGAILKRLVASQGQRHRPQTLAKQQRLKPMKLQASIMTESEVTEALDRHSTQGDDLKQNSILITDRPLEMIGQTRARADTQQRLSIEPEVQPHAPDAHLSLNAVNVVQNPEVEQLRLSSEAADQYKVTTTQGEDASPSEAHILMNSYQTNVSIHDCIFVDSVESQIEPKTSDPTREDFQTNVSDLTNKKKSQPSSPTLDGKQAKIVLQQVQHEATATGGLITVGKVFKQSSQDSSVFIMQEEVGKALEQSSVVTYDEKVIQDATTELLKGDEALHSAAVSNGPQFPPSPVSRISISSRRSGRRKTSNPASPCNQIRALHLGQDQNNGNKGAHLKAPTTQGFNTEPFEIQEVDPAKGLAIGKQSSSQKRHATQQFQRSLVQQKQPSSREGCFKSLNRGQDRLKSISKDSQASDRHLNQQNVDLKNVAIDFLKQGEGPAVVQSSTPLQARSIPSQQQRVRKAAHFALDCQYDTQRAHSRGSPQFNQPPASAMSSAADSGQVPSNLPMNEEFFYTSNQLFQSNKPKRISLVQRKSPTSESGWKRKDPSPEQVRDKLQYFSQTAKEWPRCQRHKKQNWRKEVMHQRKSLMGLSQLKPSSELKRKAIERLRLHQKHNVAVETQRLRQRGEYEGDRQSNVHVSSLTGTGLSRLSCTQPLLFGDIQDIRALQKQMTNEPAFDDYPSSSFRGHQAAATTSHLPTLSQPQAFIFTKSKTPETAQDRFRSSYEQHQQGQRGQASSRLTGGAQSVFLVNTCQDSQNSSNVSFDINRSQTSRAAGHEHLPVQASSHQRFGDYYNASQTLRTSSVQKPNSGGVQVLSINRLARGLPSRTNAAPKPHTQRRSSSRLSSQLASNSVQLDIQICKKAIVPHLNSSKAAQEPNLADLQEALELSGKEILLGGSTDDSRSPLKDASVLLEEPQNALADHIDSIQEALGAQPQHIAHRGSNHENQSRLSYVQSSQSNGSGGSPTCSNNYAMAPVSIATAQNPRKQKFNIKVLSSVPSPAFRAHRLDFTATQTAVDCGSSKLIASPNGAKACENMTEDSGANACFQSFTQK